jgi:hypothetical protein
MTTDRIEQLKARLKTEEREKEEAFQKRLEEIRESQAEFRAEQEEKERAEEQKRQKLHDDLRHKREQEMKSSAYMAWLDAGGRADEFEQGWPEMWKQMLRERALEGDAEARREAFGRNIKAF